MLEEGSLFADRYILKHLLGRGGFSEVWLVEDQKSGLDVALKVYAPYGGLDDKGTELFCKEFALVFNINQTNLLKPTYYDVYERSPYLILPYCSKGSILSMVGEVKPDDLLNIIHDVAAGLEYLHRQDPPIIHQDIKPDNILMGEHGDFLITDFGISTKARSTLRKSSMLGENSGGTYAYMSPERFSKTPAPIKASDIWSLGAMAFELAEGFPPFDNMGGVLQKNGADVPVIQSAFPDNVKNLIYKCLSKDPWDRPTAAEIVQWTEKIRIGEAVDFGFSESEPKINAEPEKPEAPMPSSVQSNLAEPERNAGKIVSFLKDSKRILGVAVAAVAAVAAIAILIVALQSSKAKKSERVELERRIHEEALANKRDSLSRVVIDSLDPNASRVEEGVTIRSIGCLIEAAEECLKTKEKVQDGILGLAQIVELGQQNHSRSAAEAAAVLSYIYAIRDVESTRTVGYVELYPEYVLDDLKPVPEISRKYSGIALELDPTCYKALFERCFDNVFGDRRGFPDFRQGVGSYQLFMTGKMYAEQAEDEKYIEIFNDFYDKYCDTIDADKQLDDEKE